MIILNIIPHIRHKVKRLQKGGQLSPFILTPELQDLLFFNAS